MESKEAALARYKTTGEYKSRDAIVLLIMLNLGVRVGEMLALAINKSKGARSLLNYPRLYAFFNFADNNEKIGKTI